MQCKQRQPYTRLSFNNHTSRHKKTTPEKNNTRTIHRLSIMIITSSHSRTSNLPRFHPQENIHILQYIYIQKRGKVSSSRLRLRLRLRPHNRRRLPHAILPTYASFPYLPRRLRQFLSDLPLPRQEALQHHLASRSAPGAHLLNNDAHQPLLQKGHGVWWWRKKTPGREKGKRGR